MFAVRMKDLLNILKQDNVKVLRAKLPYKVGGACTLDRNKYVILLNTHGKNKPVTALLHELIHIYHNDFENKNTLNFIEHRAYLLTKIARKNLNHKTRSILNNIIQESDFLQSPKEDI